MLLRDGRPKTLREIASEVPGYPEQEGEARRQAFERDKRTLRDGGIEVKAIPIDGPEQVGYVIRPEDYYLPALDLAPDEQTALNLAVAGVHLGDPSGRDALWRLGLPAAAGARPVAELPALPALPELYDAIRARATVSFEYRGDTRRVDPALLRFHGGWWYLVGYDIDHAGPPDVPGRPHGRRAERRCAGVRPAPRGLRPRRPARRPVAHGRRRPGDGGAAGGRHPRRPRRRRGGAGRRWRAGTPTARSSCGSRSRT